MPVGCEYVFDGVVFGEGDCCEDEGLEVGD